MKARFFKFSLGGILILGIAGLVVMLLWNSLIPSIFGLTVINYWQALGLWVLSRILFGGFGGRGGFFHHRENPIHKRWRQMTPEQRKEFVEKRRRFGMMNRHFFDRAMYEESGKDQ